MRSRASVVVMSILAGLVLSTTAVHAQPHQGLASFGPISAATFGYPAYYVDQNGFAAGTCLDPANLLCGLAPLPDPNAPIDIATGNFFPEHLYTFVTASVPMPGGPADQGLVVFAITGTFGNAAGAPILGDQVVFSRVRFRIDTPAAVRYSALFPAFEADAMVAMIEHEPVGEDGVADLILLNYKGADFVGHKYGPDSQELRVTLGEMDRHLARVLGALEKKVGNDYLLAVTADHGMPSEPSSADRRHYAPSIVDLLNNEFDPEGKQLVTAFEPENLQIFIDEDRLSKLGLTLPDLARFLRSQPFLFWAFTSEEVRQAAAGL